MQHTQKQSIGFLTSHLSQPSKHLPTPHTRRNPNLAQLRTHTCPLFLIKGCHMLSTQNECSNELSITLETGTNTKHGSTRPPLRLPGGLALTCTNLSRRGSLESSSVRISNQGSLPCTTGLSPLRENPAEAYIPRRPALAMRQMRRTLGCVRATFSTYAWGWCWTPGVAKEYERQGNGGGWLRLFSVDGRWIAGGSLLKRGESHSTGLTSPRTLVSSATTRKSNMVSRFVFGRAWRVVYRSQL